MIQDIVNKGEYRAPLYDNEGQPTRYHVPLPYVLHHYLGDVDVIQYLESALLKLKNHYTNALYKDKIWVWAEALDSMITIETYVNTDDENEAIELTELFQYDCFFDMEDDEAIYI